MVAFFQRVGGATCGLGGAEGGIGGSCCGGGERLIAELGIVVLRCGFACRDWLDGVADVLDGWLVGGMVGLLDLAEVTG